MSQEQAALPGTPSPGLFPRPGPPNLRAACPLCIPGTGRDAKPSTQCAPTTISPRAAMGPGALLFRAELSCPPCQASPPPLSGLSPAQLSGRWVSPAPSISLCKSGPQPYPQEVGSPSTQREGVICSGHIPHIPPPPFPLRPASIHPSIHPTSGHCQVQPGQRPLAASLPAVMPECTPRSAQGAHGKGPEVEGKEG